MLEELKEAPKAQAVARMNYSHTDMIDFIIANPGVTQNEVAKRYGYSPAWISQVMSSDAWLNAMATRRWEMVDPTLVATIEERFRMVTTKSLERLMDKLSAPQVSDQVVLRAAELGAKVMNIGGAGMQPQAPMVDHLASLANRLLDLQSKTLQQGKGVTLDGESSEIPAAG